MASVRGTDALKNYHRQNLFVGMADGMTVGEFFLHGLHGLVAANYGSYSIDGLANYTDPAVRIRIPKPPGTKPARLESLHSTDRSTST